MKVKVFFILLFPAVGWALFGCGGSHEPAAGRSENAGSGLDTGHYVRMCGLKWKRFNLGARALPEEAWEECLSDYFSYDARAAWIRKHCVNGWRLPTAEDFERLVPARRFISEWGQDGRWLDSALGITYELRRAGRKQYFLRLIQGADTLEFPAAGHAARERSVGINGIYMTGTLFDPNFVRVYYLDPSFAGGHKWGRTCGISVRLVKDDE